MLASLVIASVFLAMLGPTAMSRQKRRKSKEKPKLDHSQRMNHLKAAALTKVAKHAWDANLRYKTISLLSEALRREPSNPEILVELATACGKQRHYKRAEELLTRLMEQAPRSASIYRRVAQVYATIDRPEKATECYRRSLELNSDLAATVPTLLELAGLYERSHQLEDSQQVLVEALARDPNNQQGRLQRAALDRRLKQTAQAESGLRELLNNESNLTSIRVQAGYELAQLLDDEQQYDEAFAALIAGKKLLQPHAKPFHQQIQLMLDKNEQLLASLSSVQYQQWQTLPEQDQSYRLAVLTGHPRSGTTLIEQVLDSHDGLKSADEFDVFSQWVFQPIVRKFHPNLPLVTALEHVPPAVRRQARATYWQQTEAIFDESLGTRMLLDKNPGMTLMLPVINWAFPEMKMLIALRDPRDVVLSCFMQKVPLTPISSCWLSLADAAEYYARAMQTWLQTRELSTSPWLEFRYEDLVQNLEEKAKQILEFLGLPWDDKVLQFYEHAREKVVRSPTYKDVTSPVYSRSVGRWQHYARHLEPIFDKLAPFVTEFGYK